MTRRYRGLHWVSRCKGGRKRLQGVTESYKELKSVTRSDKGLQGVTGG